MRVRWWTPVGVVLLAVLLAGCDGGGKTGKNSDQDKPKPAAPEK